MSFQRDRPKGTPDDSRRELESPFLDEELFVDAEAGSTEERTSRLIGYQLESPFQFAFKQEDEAFDEGEEVDRYSDKLDEQELEELEEQEFDEEMDDEGLVTELQVANPSAPRLLGSETTPPSQTLYVEIDLGIGKAPNKDKTLFKVQPCTGIFIPEHYSPQSQVDLILYLHGHKAEHPGDDVSIDRYWGNPKKLPFFSLREGVNASGKNVILVAPTLGPLAQSGILTEKKGFDKYLDQVVEALKAHGPYQGTSPTVGNIILACHSGGGTPMLALALSTDRCAANIKECWGFDSLYGGEEAWATWARKNKNTGMLYMYYYPTTGYKSKKLKRFVKLKEHADRLANKKLTNVLVKEADPKTVKGHFRVPIAYWTDRIKNAPLSSQPAFVPEVWEALGESAAEEPEEFLDESDEGEFDEEMDAPAFAELFADDDEERDTEEPEEFLNELDEQEWDAEAAIDALAEFFAGEEQTPEAGALLDKLDAEFEEEVEQEALDGIDPLAESPAADSLPFSPPMKKPVEEPLAIPVSDPVPFAEPPPRESHWPVRTANKEGRSVAFAFKVTDGTLVATGTRGQGRMFMADRKGKRDGKETLRWHVGVDLFANVGDSVVACEDGTIVSFSYFYPAAPPSGQKTYRLLVEHSKVVINYGEVTANSLVDNNLKEGSSVKAGQVIGFVSDTSMLHFETYIKGTTNSHRWWKDEQKPPLALLNPTRYLLFLQEHGLPGSNVGAQPAHPLSSTLRSLGERIQDALNLGWWSVALGFAILGGERDVKNLTNLVFYARHRDLEGHKIQPHEKDLVREWLAIRDSLVKPALKLASSTGRAPALPVVTRGDDVQQSLALLGYDLSSKRGTDVLERALRDFQQDVGIPSSGRLDTKTGAALHGLLDQLQHASNRPLSLQRMSRFRLTSYYVALESSFPDNPVIPALDQNGQVIAKVDPAFFLSMSVEGTGRLRNGDLLNVVGSKEKGGIQDITRYPEYQQLLEVARTSYKKRLEPDRIGATGVRLKEGRVVSVLAFYKVPESKKGEGYGIGRQGISHEPFKTLAADIGAYVSSDPRFRRKDGLVPLGTRVFILELAGVRLPDGTIHDGWCTVNDTGSAIFGAHFDVFTGSLAWSKQANLPRIAHVWFNQSEERCPPDYVYGLFPK